MECKKLLKNIFLSFIFLFYLVNGKPIVVKDSLFDVGNIFPFFGHYMDNLGNLYQDYKKNTIIKIVNETKSSTTIPVKDNNLI
uniref:Uncharacterized protein n=1 Tax=Strongyloides venezuelensis TaxID=75913 RepID=A0A0K0F220_STRVS